MTMATASNKGSEYLSTQNSNSSCQPVGELAPYSSAVVAESYPVTKELIDWPIILEMINLFKYCSLVYCNLANIPY